MPPLNNKEDNKEPAVITYCATRARLNNKCWKNLQGIENDK